MKTSVDAPTPHRPSPSLVRLGSRLILAASCVLWLAACDRPSPAEQAIEDASKILVRLGTGTGAAPIPDASRESYAEVRSTLGSLEGATPGQRAAADLLIAETHLGEGSLALRDAMQTEQQAALADLRIRNLIRAWELASTDLEVARAFDPADRTETIKVELERSRDEQRSLREQAASLRDQARELADERDALMDRAERERDIAARAALSRAPTPGPVSLALLRTSELHRRAAQTLELRAEKLDIRADAIGPQIERIEKQINQLDREQEALTEARRRLDAQARSASQTADEARQRIEQLASEIESMLLGPVPPDAEVPALEEFQAAQVSQGFADAADSFAQASRLAQGARASLRAQADTIDQRATSRLWTLHLASLRSHERHHRLLDRISQIGALDSTSLDDAIGRTARARAQAIPELAESVGDVEDVDPALIEAFTQAAERVAQAIEQGGSTLDRALDQARRSLDDLISARGEAARRALSEDAFAGSAPSPSSVAQASQPATQADTSTPESLMDLYIQRVSSGQMSQSIELFTFDSPDQRAFYAIIAEVSDATIALDQATLDRFGQRVSEQFDNNQMASGLSMADLAQLRAADLDIRTNGDTATVTLPGQPQPLTMRRVDGRWSFDGGSLLGPQLDQTPPQMRAGLQTAMTDMSAGFTNLAQRVRDGDFQDISAVNAALQGLVAQMIQSMMGSMGGGG